ncbi:cytochrome c [Marivirga sp. S37H4]|uniref:Cytochrome c n=1 Tax=Marivirga aurantiaca TaxID=2802615 RepID=A0A935CC64_9BACT|nr:cytochrome c [Marivirga aurantiaca]MBK6265798.1 cytochrome c [Marivirga aurantiaca]
MEIGILHTHVTVVTLFLLFLLFKSILLFTNKIQLLTTVRTKFKVADSILGVLILVTGGYLLTLYGADTPMYLWVKSVIVLIIIPIGIVAFKKENKMMALLALLLTFYIYGVSESGSLTFSRESASIEETDGPEPEMRQEEQPEIIAQNMENVLKTGKEIYLAECKKCHGVDGKKGLFKSPDLTESNLNLAERIAWIKKGKGVMPAYEGELSEEDIEAVAAYLNELK